MPEREPRRFGDAESEALRRVSLGRELRRALTEGELQLAYQPVVNMLDGAVCGVEALLRWDHPHLGLMWPGEFLDAVHGTELGTQLLRWVMHEALTQAAGWRTRFPDHPIWVSVNVVGHDFVSEGLLSDVIDLLQTHRLEPSCLALEVKERDVFDDPYGLVRERLETIKQAGIGVLVDDFGNAHAALMTALEAWPPNVTKIYPGFVSRVATEAYEATVASMNTLRDWPIDVLKLDRSLLDRLFTDHGAEPLVDGLVRLARSLGLRTLATSIESPGEARQLYHLGCDMAQGYYFHRPQTPDYVDLLLAEQHHDPARPPSVADDQALRAGNA
ncbi:MAG TPA: EAL domain-containing protein [Acidimicrobiia bacterium]|nr:EAL domain-containing protein [Acidimicrobiia bacterium]